ncbi:phage minor tail protein L [Tateyamaria sp. syn59]|uniref:phage minor tail protein L n=1 Tax=Tateyamaria sp. syn59 TaxID=2576942 RepID=UPI0011BF3345|nr:phage minor tail protein L [Tateyamaria sp. syn59]
MHQFEDPMRRELEGFAIDDVVELFTVDARMIGGDVYRFAPTSVPGAADARVQPVFGGETYAVIPFESEGWEWSAGGTLPQPTVRFLMAREDGDQVSVAAFLLSMVEAYDDLLGAQVHRLQTLRKFLDDGSEPNPQAHMGVEIYTVTQKTKQTPDMIEFRLSSALDLEDVVLPRRQVLNYCQWAYRRARSDGSFDYSNATCPYVGMSYFDATGNPVSDPRQDRCRRQLSDCKLRFGQHAKLPFGGFPGAGKFRG